MTDGWVRTGELTALVEKMREEGITLSVIAAGEGSAEYLKALAEDGGGRYYPAVDMMSVPDIFLKETVKSVGQYIIEEPFYPLPASPSPVLRGIDQNYAARPAGLQRHLPQKHRPPGPADPARRPAAGLLAVRAGPLGSLDLGSERPVGHRLGELE